MDLINASANAWETIYLSLILRRNHAVDNFNYNTIPRHLNWMVCLPTQPYLLGFITYGTKPPPDYTLHFPTFGYTLISPALGQSPLSPFSSDSVATSSACSVLHQTQLSLSCRPANAITALCSISYCNLLSYLRPGLKKSPHHHHKTLIPSKTWVNCALHPRLRPNVVGSRSIQYKSRHTWINI